MKVRKKINGKKAGQTLLVVVVISTLALLILLSMADRVTLSRVNTQKTAEFDRSIAASDNKINEVIQLLYDSDNDDVTDCLANLRTTTNQFVELDCNNVFSGVNGLPINAKVYGRVAADGYVEVTPDYPLMLKMSDELTNGLPTTSVEVSCKESRNVLVTRVFYENGQLLVDEGIIANCSNNYKATTLYRVKSDGSTENGSAIVRENTIYVRARVLDNQPTSNVSLRVYNNINGIKNLVASTEKYEFMVTGLGNEEGSDGLGSDSIVTFERGLGQTSNGVPKLFDYAYLETTRP